MPELISDDDYEDDEDDFEFKDDDEGELEYKVMIEDDFDYNPTMGRTATEMDEFFRAPKKEEYEETKDTLEFLRRADREKK